MGRHRMRRNKKASTKHSSSLFPSAKLALVDHARGTLLAAACGLEQASEDFDEDDLYAAMDQLNGHWVGIEKQLYQKSFLPACWRPTASHT